MEKDIRQLVEMGATVAQARAALKKCSDVMQAAEQIFDGRFDDLVEDEVVDAEILRDARSQVETNHRLATPDEDDVLVDDEEDEEDDSVDYNSDYDAEVQGTLTGNADPYAGIFFSKDRREEVIEIEEDEELVEIAGSPEPVRILAQAQWMKGCPEAGEQGFLFSLYSQLSEGSCACPRPHCGASVPRDRSNFFAVYHDFSSYINHLSRLVRQTCPTCSKEFCLACGESYSPETQNSWDVNDFLFHCSNLQGVILGMGLYMLEELYIEETKYVPSPNIEKNAKKRKAQSTISSAVDLDDDDDLYYGGKGKRAKAKGGIGYAGDLREDVSGQMEALSLQRTRDKNIGDLLIQIRHYLPCVQRQGGGRTSDYLVHPTTLAHLRRRFNFVSSSLLRNDSLSDMSDRAILYFELFEWLETISNHEALASMMAMPIMVAGSVKDVKTRKLPDSRQARERTVVYEGSSGPRELLESIVVQAQAALRGLEGMKPLEIRTEESIEAEKRVTNQNKGKGKIQEVSMDEDNLKLYQFCKRIMATAKAIDRSLRETKGDEFVDRLHKSLIKVPAFSRDAPDIQISIEPGHTEEETKKIYLEWANQIRFASCDLTLPPTEGSEGPSYKSCFNNDIRLLADSNLPKRALAIAKELAVLTTNLPVAWDSSIFLRVDESRVDVLKALITGPEGTPYHNGCFLFDIFLGASYNTSPPSVKYMTTNGGKYRFNPNLYADGKVCLSLLGTWRGPGWIPGKSTLLQVLISIQSMILCDEPYLNEPGWAGDGGSPQSKTYSANIRRMVVHTAMLGMLRNPPEPFEDVIRTHFKLKARPIMRQLDEWLEIDDGQHTFGDGAGHGIPSQLAQTNPQGSSLNSLQKNVNELKIELRKLLGEDVSHAEDAEPGGVNLEDAELNDVELDSGEMQSVSVESNGGEPGPMVTV